MEYYYHVSTEIIEKPSLSPPNVARKNNRGGFFTVSSKIRAVCLASSMSAVRGADYFTVNVYEFVSSTDELNIQFFDSADDKWFLFLFDTACGNQASTWDIVTEPVANGAELSALRENRGDREAALRAFSALPHEKRSFQTVFFSEAALEKLKFCGSINAKEESPIISRFTYFCMKLYFRLSKLVKLPEIRLRAAYHGALNLMNKFARWRAKK